MTMMAIPTYDPFADARKTCLCLDYDERGKCRECGAERTDEVGIDSHRAQIEALRNHPDAVPADSLCWGAIPGHTHDGRGRCVFCGRLIRDPHNAEQISDAHPQEGEEDRGALLAIF